MYGTYVLYKFNIRSFFPDIIIMQFNIQDNPMSVSTIFICYMHEMLCKHNRRKYMYYTTTENTD